MSERESRPSPVRRLLNGVVATMVIVQVGLSGLFIFYALVQTWSGRLSPGLLWLVVIVAIIALDAFLVRWLFRMADGLGTQLDPDHEGEPG